MNQPFSLNNYKSSSTTNMDGDGPPEIMSEISTPVNPILDLDINDPLNYYLCSAANFRLRYDGAKYHAKATITPDIDELGSTIEFIKCLPVRFAFCGTRCGLPFIQKVVITFRQNKLIGNTLSELLSFTYEPHVWLSPGLKERTVQVFNTEISSFRMGRIKLGPDASSGAEIHDEISDTNFTTSKTEDPTSPLSIKIEDEIGITVASAKVTQFQVAKGKKKKGNGQINYKEFLLSFNPIITSGATRAVLLIACIIWTLDAHEQLLRGRMYKLVLLTFVFILGFIGGIMHLWYIHQK